MTVGYEPVTTVTEPGTFSRRGGILDIFPLACAFPVRIEFFDDEIESLREFDPQSQRSIGEVSSVTIIPAREALLDNCAGVARQLEKWVEALRTDDEDISGLASDIEALAAGNAFPHLEHYLPYLYSNPVSLLDYAPDNTLIVIEDEDEFREAVEGIITTAQNSYGEALAPQPNRRCTSYALH